jgi:hypothetical protein
MKSNEPIKIEFREQAQLKATGSNSGVAFSFSVFVTSASWSL